METTRNLREGSRFPGRDLNSGPSEYGGMLTTPPRCKPPCFIGSIFIFTCELKITIRIFGKFYLCVENCKICINADF
jgi:hypothetical protein